MGSKAASILLHALALILLFTPAASATTLEDSEDVDIDSYITLEIVFDEGESLDLKAVISATPDPITIFLIKGTEEFNRWKSTEDIDIEAILTGEEVPKTNTTFTVIRDFSKENTTFFENSISIGEKDTYYLVIVIHRNEDMTKQDILSRASRVDYVLSYEENEKDVPYYLIPIAVIIFLIGTALIVFYVRSIRKDSGEESPETVTDRRRRSPPMR